MKCCRTNFVCPFTANKLGSCISSLVLAGIHLNTESAKEWSEERFNGVFSIHQTSAWGKCLYEKKTGKLSAKLVNTVNCLNRFPTGECRMF